MRAPLRARAGRGAAALPAAADRCESSCERSTEACQDVCKDYKGKKSVVLAKCKQLCADTKKRCLDGCEAKAQTPPPEGTGGRRHAHGHAGGPRREMKAGLVARARGQALVEYSVVTAALLGFTVLGWSFLVQLLNGLHRYYQSLYYIIQSPIPWGHGPVGHGGTGQRFLRVRAVLKLAVAG